LPQPEGPINAVTLLRGTTMLMENNARFDPYQRSKSLIETTSSTDLRASCSSVSKPVSRWTASKTPPFVTGPASIRASPAETKAPCKRR